MNQDNKTDPLGHDVKVTTIAPTCLETGYDLHSCSRCQMEERHNEVAALDHNYGDWKMMKEPTVEEKGLQVRKCRACEATEEREVERLVPEQTQSPTQPSAEPAPTQPIPTLAFEPSTQQSTETVPAQSVEMPTIAQTGKEPVQQGPEEPVKLVPVIILGVVLLIATGAGVLYLFRKKHEIHKN